MACTRKKHRNTLVGFAATLRPSAALLLCSSRKIATTNIQACLDPPGAKDPNTYNRVYPSPYIPSWAALVTIYAMEKGVSYPYP